MSPRSLVFRSNTAIGRVPTERNKNGDEVSIYSSRKAGGRFNTSYRKRFPDIAHEPQARNCRKPDYERNDENAVECCRIVRKDDIRDQGPDDGTECVHCAVVAERTAHLFLGRRERDQGIPRRVAQAFANTIHEPQTDDGPHASREHIKGSRENRERVAYDGEYLALLYPVRPAAGIDFYEIGRGLRNAFNEAQRFRTGFQYRYKERRKYRRNHLRGKIVEEAGQPQEENIAR